MIFSEKNIYKKLVFYTGTLTKGRMSLTPLIKIVGLLSLIDRYAGNGFPLKSIVPQDIQHNWFQDTQVKWNIKLVMNLKNYKNKIGQPILVYTHLNMNTRFPIFEGKFELLTMGFNS